MKVRNKILTGAAILIVLLVILLSLKFPYTIKAPCHIVSKEEWSLLKVDPEKLKSRLVDNMDGKISSYSLLQFEREDFVQFKINPSLNDNQWVGAGDTIAVLSSSKNKMMLANFQGELQKARANLAMVSTGEKAALQEEALQALRMAEVEYESFEPQYLRRKELFEEGLISTEEWENTRATYNIYRSNVAMAKARLESIRSGEKKEMIRYIQAEIALIREQIRLMNDKMKYEIIRSPVDGILTFSGTDSLICRVDKIDTLLIRLAIPAGKLKHAEPGQTINVRITETGKEYSALLTNIHKRSYFINRMPVYIITGRIENEGIDLAPGMSGYATIQAGKTTLFSRLVGAFKEYAGINLFKI